MHRSAWVLAAVVVGLGVGLAAAYSDLRRLGVSGEQLFYPDEARTALAIKSTELTLRPEAYTGETHFDFGRMERGETRSHAFVIENRGKGPLTLTKGKTSCKCTLSGLDQDELGPGESGTVTLEWTANTAESDFRQTATVHTNDPHRPSIEFAVEGKVYQEIELEPKGLYVSKLAGESQSYEVRMTSANFADLQVVGHTFDDPATAAFFEVAYRPLTPEELAANSNFGPSPLGGALLKVTLKPGLPLGPFRQTIRLDTNEPERSRVPLVVAGTVEGDISVVGGRDWNRDKMLLTLGSVSARETTRRELKLLVRGEQAGNVEFTVRRVEPPQLEVHLGEAKPLSGGRVQQTPLTIELPRGLPGMTYLGTEPGECGEITLSTSHPLVPELKLRVRFAIEP